MSLRHLEIETHELKSWPESFNAVRNGHKTHEVRVNDRGFRVGDRLVLREWSPIGKRYTGKEVMVVVRYITPGGSFGLPDRLCVMSVELVRTRG